MITWHVLLKTIREAIENRARHRQAMATLKACGVRTLTRAEQQELRRDALVIISQLAAVLPGGRFREYRRKPGMVARAVMAYEMHGIDGLPTMDAIKRGVTLELSEDGRSLKIGSRERFADPLRQGTARFGYMRALNLKPRPFLGNEEKTNHRGAESTEEEQQ